MSAEETRTKEEAKKGMNSSKIIIVVTAVLLVVVTVLAVINYQDMQDRLTYHVEGSFRVINGDEYHYISLDDLLNLSPQVVTSSPRGEERSFTGVPLAVILRYLEIDYSHTTGIYFRSIDGFATAIAIAEALDESNAFIVFEENGEALGIRGELWEDAPFMLVMAQDRFANRWGRYIFEIVLQNEVII